MKDELGDRIKGNYEDRTRYMLPRRTYTLIRIDGKAFHTYTRNLEKPFDEKLIQDLDYTVQKVLSEFQGAAFAYVQSDEISILLTDFATPTTSAWFDGNLQKITSISSSLVTAAFNLIRGAKNFKELAHFDARACTIPDPWETYNYFVWRNQDAIRNAISSQAQALYSHKELQGKTGTQKLKMIAEKGVDWDKVNPGHRFGRLILKQTELMPPAFPNKEMVDMAEKDPEKFKNDFTITRWRSLPAWKFTNNPKPLQALIPNFPEPIYTSPDFDPTQVLPANVIDLAEQVFQEASTNNYEPKLTALEKQEVDIVQGFKYESTRTH